MKEKEWKAQRDSWFNHEHPMAVANKTWKEKRIRMKMKAVTQTWKPPLMRGWFLNLREVDVDRLVEILTLVKKAMMLVKKALNK
jgi:hypothetical protein